MRIALLLVCACSRATVSAPAPNAPSPVPSAPAPSAPADGPAPLVDIDRLLHEAWREARVTPAAPVDDAGFLRRATLDLVGRIPTPEEVAAFTAKPDRAAWVDRLLASREAAEHWAALTTDLLVGDALAGAPPQRRERVEAKLRAWLADGFESGRGWDAIATDLVSATGDTDDVAAAWFIGLHARGREGVVAVAGASSRAFLGVQLQCAQCHDHPYDDRYKQEDFWGFAAYFARTRARRSQGDGSPGFEIVDLDRGQARMPRPDSDERVVVKPRFLGRELEHDRGERRRPVLARGIVGSDLFAKAAVNRAWKQLFGRGLVDPWDDLGGERDSSHPPLLVRLADDFRANRHELRRLYKTIALSDAYARGSFAPGEPGDDVRAFARAAVRPLAAGPLVRSLVVATGIEDAMRGDEESIARRLLRARLEYETVSSDDEMTADTGFDGSVPQALLLLNGEILNRGALARGDTRVARIVAESHDPGARVDAAYTAAFARRPTDEERARRVAWLRERGDDVEAFEDLFFALLASSEFTTNH